jgi:hypothetical protein
MALHSGLKFSKKLQKLIIILRPVHMERILFYAINRTSLAVEIFCHIYLVRWLKFESRAILEN